MESITGKKKFHSKLYRIFRLLKVYFSKNNNHKAPREKPVFNTRKPGEGEITSKLEKLVLKKREDDIGGSDQQEEEYEVDEVNDVNLDFICTIFFS